MPLGDMFNATMPIIANNSFGLGSLTAARDNAAWDTSTNIMNVFGGPDSASLMDAADKAGFNAAIPFQAVPTQPDSTFATKFLAPATPWVAPVVSPPVVEQIPTDETDIEEHHEEWHDEHPEHPHGPGHGHGNHGLHKGWHKHEGHGKGH